MEEYTIVINKETLKIETIFKHAEGTTLSASSVLYLKENGSEEKIANYALDNNCNMIEFQEKLDLANETISFEDL